MTDWTIIRRSLAVRFFSTAVTTLSVAVAVALVLVLLMMRGAGEAAFRRGSGNMHLVVTRDEGPLAAVLNAVFYAGTPRRPIEWGVYEKLAASAPFEYAVPTQLGDSYKGRRVLATTPEFFSKFRPAADASWSLSGGRIFENDFEVVAGAEAARSLDLRLGDKIVLTHGAGGSREGGAGAAHEHRAFAYNVVGILAPTGSAHDRALFTSLQSSWIIHAHDRLEREEAAGHDDHGHHDHEHDHAETTAADVTDADKKITGVYLRLQTRPGSDTPANLPQVFDALRRDPSITVAQPQQEITSLLRIVGNVNQILLFMALVVMASSGVSILLALYNSMAQRRRQIAVLRVLGCSRARVFGLLLTESAVLGALGAALGVGLSLLAIRLVSSVMHSRLGLAVEPVLPLDLALVVGVGTVLLAALAGVVPALAGYRTSVVNNLRPLA